MLFSNHHWSAVTAVCLCVLGCQIELDEQRRSGRGGRAKDSKRKRKSHRGASGEAGEPSLDASESKKTCTSSHSSPAPPPAPPPPAHRHPEVAELLRHVTENTLSFNNVFLYCIISEAVW